MKLTPNIPAEIQNALRLLGKALPETDEEIDAFIAEVESGNIEVPATPQHLKPAAIAEALILGRRPEPAAKITPFPKSQPQSGIEGLKLAARNGDGPLSEETIRKMKEAQED